MSIFVDTKSDFPPSVSGSKNLHRAHKKPEKLHSVSAKTNRRARRRFLRHQVQLFGVLENPLGDPVASPGSQKKVTFPAAKLTFRPCGKIRKPKKFDLVSEKTTGERSGNLAFPAATRMVVFLRHQVKLFGIHLEILWIQVESDGPQKVSLGIVKKAPFVFCHTKCNFLGSVERQVASHGTQKS